MPIDSSFVKAPVNVPRLSGFDKSHQNLLTTKVGTITPILCDVLIPGAKVKLDLAISASLPPLASDTFLRASLKTEAFFVPFRILCGSFESWFTDTEKQMIDASGSISFNALKGFLPVIGGFNAATTSALATSFDAGTLADYLGFKSYEMPEFTNKYISAMPFLAYHRIYSDWYRNSLVQRESFCRPMVMATLLLALII